MTISCIDVNGIKNYNYTHTNGNVYTFQLRLNGNTWDAYMNDTLISSGYENRPIGRNAMIAYIKGL